MKLNRNQMHTLVLAQQGADENGWADVSSSLWRFMFDIPSELLSKIPGPDGTGRVKLTDGGRLILKYSQGEEFPISKSGQFLFVDSPAQEGAKP